MRKLLAILLFTAIASPAYAGGDGSSDKPLDGVYPIILSHGLFGWGEDSSGIISITDYWGGMDDYLRSQGAAVYAPAKTATQSNEYRAQELREKILYYMAANGHNQVHILGHSQGGLDSRYMVSNLNMGSQVSTLTSLNTPHRGSPIADIVKTIIPDWMLPFVSDVLGVVTSIVYGGGEQNALNALNALTGEGLTAFNNNTPNNPAVKYYSYGSYMTLPDPIQHPTMFLLHPACAAGGLVKGQGATNDGLVPISSQRWGTWKGGPSYSWYVSGVDHLQASNSLYSGSAWYDVEGYYLKMATNAMNNQ